jgi:uncharacterized membrane protein HdeD (DUF308 family)
MATSTAPGKRSVVVSKERRDALSEVLADNWWAVGLRGVIGIVFGLICLLTPGIALVAFVALFAAYMLVDGAFALAAAWKAARSGDRWAPLILEGIVDIAAAVIAFSWPVASAVAFIWVVAFWALISGGLMLYAAFTLNREHGRWWLALGGISSLIFGALLVIEPLVGAVVLTMWIGAYSLVFGIFLLILAFQLHSRKEEREHKAPAAAKKA